MNKEMYDEICESRFTSIDDKLDTIVSMLKGEGREPGLIDDVRELNKFKKTCIGVLSLFGITLFTQMAVWVRGIITKG